MEYRCINLEKKEIPYKDFTAYDREDIAQRFRTVIEAEGPVVDDFLELKVLKSYSIYQRGSLIAHIEGIEYLINKGAEINRNDLMGENALMYVIQNPNMPTEEKLKAVQLLIDHGIDVNWLNSRFETPLMMALNQIEIEVAELLIDNGGIVYQPPQRPKEPDTNE